MHSISVQGCTVSSSPEKIPNNEVKWFSISFPIRHSLLAASKIPKRKEVSMISGVIDSISQAFGAGDSAFMATMRIDPVI